MRWRMSCNQHECCKTVCLLRLPHRHSKRDEKAHGVNSVFQSTPLADRALTEVESSRMEGTFAEALFFKECILGEFRLRHK